VPRGPGACLFLLALAGACAGADDGPSCPNDLPQECPADAPGYATTIRPIVDTYCVPCHNPDGRAAVKPFLTYQQIYDRRRDVLTQVYACKMPAEGGMPLPLADREALLAWLVCGAKEN